MGAQKLILQSITTNRRRRPAGTVHATMAHSVQESLAAILVPQSKYPGTVQTMTKRVCPGFSGEGADSSVAGPALAAMLPQAPYGGSISGRLPKPTPDGAEPRKQGRKEFTAVFGLNRCQVEAPLNQCFATTTPA